MCNIQFVDGPYPDSEEFKYKKLLEIAQNFNCSHFIEFGSYQGNSVCYLYKYFTKITTIEPVEEYYEITRGKCRDFENVNVQNMKALEFLQGFQDDGLKTLFWVDGHVQPPFTGNASNDVFEEVKLVFEKMTSRNFVLLIDDNRLLSQWCLINELYAFLEDNCDLVQVQSDMILAVPSKVS